MLTRVVVVAAAVTAAFNLVACASTNAAETSTRSASKATTPAPAARTEVGGAVSADPSAPSEPIYFAFDSDALTPDGQRVLRNMAAYLNTKAGTQATVEGHCDDAGTPEYNLALGARRAEAIVTYLRGLGIQNERLRSVSYGEERPAVAGASDAAKAKNRRGQFALNNR